MLFAIAAKRVDSRLFTVAGVGVTAGAGVGVAAGADVGTFFVRDVNVGPTEFKFPLGKVVPQRSVTPSRTSTAAQG